MIEDVRIYLAALWIVLMLIYLLGDVLRIFSGDFSTPGVFNGVRVTQAMMLGVAMMMLIPILMIFLSLTVAYPAIRWLNIIAAGFFFLFNLVSLRGYPGHYDKFLLAVSLVFNILTIVYAARWEPEA